MKNEEIVKLIQAGINVPDNMLALWQQNKGLIYTMANKFKSYADIEDLEQEGYLGLYNAAKGYDDTQGAKFSTYALLWIKQAMYRYIENNGDIIRIPVHMKERIQLYKKINRQYKQEYGTEPTKEEKAFYMELEENQIEEIERTILNIDNITSINIKIGESENEYSILDTVKSKEDIEEDAIKKFDTEQMSKELRKTIEELEYKSGTALKEKYLSEKTLQEIGDILGVSKERARQYVNKGLKDIRKKKPSEKGKYAPILIHI